MGFTYNACETFAKHGEGIQKFRETCNLKHLHENELDKACFAHDAACSDLAKGTVSDMDIKED